MLQHADRYGLKWVIVRDPYYDPLLDFAGWRQVDELDDKTITIWSKDGVPPATADERGANASSLARHYCGARSRSAAAFSRSWWC